jgi:hypothetical protein
MNISYINSEQLCFQLTKAQLAQIEDSLAPQKMSTHSLTKLTVVLIISILFHVLFIFSVNISQRPTIQTSINRPLNIKLETQAMPSREKADTSDIDKKTIIENVEINAQAKVTKQSQQSIRTNLPVKESIVQPTNKPINIEDIHDSIQNNVSNNNFQLHNINQKNRFFNSQYQKQLDTITFLKSKSIDEQKQFKQSNQYFEFQPMGQTEVVRVNGSCYLLQDLAVFGESGKQWLYQGNCARKKKLKFKVSPLSYLNRNKLINQ